MVKTVDYTSCILQLHVSLFSTVVGGWAQVRKEQQQQQRQQRRTTVPQLEVRQCSGWPSWARCKLSLSFLL